MILYRRGIWKYLFQSTFQAFRFDFGFLSSMLHFIGYLRFEFFKQYSNCIYTYLIFRNIIFTGCCWRMLPLLLSNNKTLKPKDQNLCFVNAGLQVLFANHEVRELLLAVEPDAFPSTWPVCKELCRLFTSQGKFEVSASAFRRLYNWPID